MWPFSKNKQQPKVTVAQALQQLSDIGIRKRANITDDDLLGSMGGSMGSRVDWPLLLCVLGDETEHGDGFERVSDDIWHFDAECIEDNGDYARAVQRFVLLAKGNLPLADIKDHVDIENEKAWVEFVLEGKKVHWDLQVDNDWFDADLYSRLQELVTARGAGKRFFIDALGQDSLVCFGDEQMKNALSGLSGLKFDWE